MSQGLTIDILLLVCIQIIFVNWLAGIYIWFCLICKHKTGLCLWLTLQEECRSARPSLVCEQ